MTSPTTSNNVVIRTIQLRMLSNVHNPPHKAKPVNKRVPPILTYHPKLAITSPVIHKHMLTLHSSDRLKQVFPDPPLVSFRRPCSLRDLLVNARLPPSDNKSSTCIEKPPEFTKCTSKKCAIRPFICEGTTFHSSVTLESWRE